MTLRIALMSVVLLACVHFPVAAHHGGAQEWLFDRVEGPLTGLATKFAYRFPHVQIFMDVTGENGEVANYVFITRWTPTVLRKHGWTRNSIKPGDSVTVTYFPHKSSATAGAIKTLAVNGVALETNFDD